MRVAERGGWLVSFNYLAKRSARYVTLVINVPCSACPGSEREVYDPKPANLRAPALVA